MRQNDARKRVAVSIVADRHYASHREKRPIATAPRFPELPVVYLRKRDQLIPKSHRHQATSARKGFF